MKTLLKAALFGGLVVFLWSTISWMMLSWHSAVLKSFKDPDAVAAVMKENAPATGIYMLPSCPQGEKMSQEEMNAAMERAKAGPYIFAMVRPGRYDFSMGSLMFNAFITQVLGAFLLAALLMTAKPLGYWQRVLFVTIAASVGVLMTLLPQWNFMEFPAEFIFVGITDLVLSWFLGGLVIAAIVKPRVV